MNQIMIESERLRIISRTIEEMYAIYQNEMNAEMKQAYYEMYQLMLQIKEREELGCDWKICLKDGTLVGGIGFKGLPDAEGKVEIGYGINEAFQNHGYATEAVRAMTEWGLKQPDICCVQAQTDPGNNISQKVLINNGYVRNGNGTEGPMFERRK